jgi:hypothetical protein
MNELATRPSILSAIDSPKAWGWEKWLTSSRPEAAAQLRDAPGTLAELVTIHPEVLGGWTRALFGEEIPFFTKFIHTDFPARVHLGFRRAVDRDELLTWLEREQALLRRLFVALQTPSAEAFSAYQTRYSKWATEQALARWQRPDDETAAALFAPFVDPSLDLPAWLAGVRQNRAKLVEALNDVDLSDELDHLLLTPAGVLHGIFGLSHQTHPLDGSRDALEVLFGVLGERAAAGASDGELSRIIEQANLPRLRAENRAPPKNEAWLPAHVEGALVLVEPQQTSDTTYSLADFYTPLTWTENRVRFRKGDVAHGLSRDELRGIVDQIDLRATSVDSIRRIPKAMPATSRPGAELFCLVDEPQEWPFFTAYRLELQGRFHAKPPHGVFQELVVMRGRVELSDDRGLCGELSSRAPAFVPATLPGRYTLAAKEPSSILILGVPGARGGAPVVTG